MNKFLVCFCSFMSLLSFTFGANNGSQTINFRQEKGLLYKGFSGYRLFNNSFRMVYYHDLTIAVIEIGDGMTLLNCELIEIFSDDQRKEVLSDLKKIVGRPLEVFFDDMIELINQCEDLDAKLINKMISSLSPNSLTNNNRVLNQTYQSNWILPGTKWCGTGDIATNYFDLGTELLMDKCCRKHDLCPVKVKGYGTRYNLANKSMYTKSHCVCDDELLKCLKLSKKPAADFMGNIYFNIVQIPCIDDTKNGRIFRSSKRY